MQIPLSKVEDKEGICTGVIKLNSLGRKFNFRRRVLGKHETLYVLYEEREKKTKTLPMQMYQILEITEQSPVLGGESEF